MIITGDLICFTLHWDGQNYMVNYIISNVPCFLMWNAFACKIPPTMHQTSENWVCGRKFAEFSYSILGVPVINMKNSLLFFNDI